jgi:hypothetical protein
MHDARVGRPTDLRRVASASARPRIPAAGRAADAHPPPADVGFLRLCLIGGNNNVNDDVAPAASDTRARASDVARALALGAAERVELLVATAAEEPGFDAVSSDREGDGSVVEVVRR